MDLLLAYQEMIRVHGWAGTAATLGMSKSALEARVYEVKGSGMRVDTALLIQTYAGTKHFAQAVACQSGGVFVELPSVEPRHGDDLEDKFRQLIVELGDLSKTYGSAKADGEIDARERAQLESIAQQMHRTLQEAMALMFHVYCRPADKFAQGDADDR